MKFLFIKSREDIEKITPLILDAFGNLINILKFSNYNNQTLVIYYNYTETSIEDITNILVTDLYLDLKVYNSINYNNESKLNKALVTVFNLFKEYYFKEDYIDNKTILKNNNILFNEEVKSLIFGNYYNNLMMYETVKVFLENNQNISESAKVLFLHRNTLTQRLDKFILETEFNVKTFIDGFLIYKLLN